MRRGTRQLIGLTAALVVTGGLFAALVFGVRAIDGLGRQPQARAATTGAHLTLSVLPDSYVCHGSPGGAPGGGSHPGWVTYCPSTNIQVPAHSTVTVTIRQYDTATPLHNAFFAQVYGTVGDVMYVNGRPFRRINPTAPGHTFTIQTPPDTGEYPLFVNIPLMGVPGNAPSTVTIAGHKYPKPVVTVFRFKTGGPGQYVWHCYVPCGTGLAGAQAGFGGPMSTVGYMSGTLNVY